MHAYPFVTLHQTAAFYGVNSQHLERTPGEYEHLSSKSEILAYYEAVLDELLATGRLRFFPLSDADITGPNLPTMLGIDEGLQSTGESGLRPVDSHGLKVVSLGFVLPAGTPVVWRGPMIGSGVRQLLHDVDWGELDYLIVDLPPGTSDASMSMAQDALIAGAVIVSTPSKVAVEDAQKAVGMFDRLGVPVFGVIENMRGEVFGSGGAEAAADDLGLEFLGHIPLAANIREAGDNGDPLDNDDLEIEELFSGIAEQVAARCSVLQFAGEGATI